MSSDPCSSLGSGLRSDLGSVVGVAASGCSSDTCETTTGAGAGAGARAATAGADAAVRDAPRSRFKKNKATASATTLVSATLGIQLVPTDCFLGAREILGAGRA